MSRITTGTAQGVREINTLKGRRRWTRATGSACFYLYRHIYPICVLCDIYKDLVEKKRGIRLDPQDCFELPALCAARRERRFHRSDCRAMVVQDVGLILSERNQKNKKNSLPYFLLERLSGLNSTFFFSIPFSSMTTVILCREFFCFVL